MPGDLIKAVNAARNIQHSELNVLVKRVAVILCSPRSGSSLLKNALESHPSIASLDGEIEPFLVLTENGFGYNSDSDAIDYLNNKKCLIDNIFDGLSTFSDDVPGANFLVKKYAKRFLLQFPVKFSKSAGFEDLLRILRSIFDENRNWAHIENERDLDKFVLSKVFENEAWRINYYDGNLSANENLWFDECLKIEEPPFVMPRIKRRPFGAEDVESKVLLFKTPPDVYRIGMYEDIFPNAIVKYIHLTRGYAQSVNGLMDGWLSPVGFFSHDLRKCGLSLNIEGYSDCVPFGKSWWKFDLPPNWRDFKNEKLENVCLNQWLSSHQAIISSGVDALRVAFEDFLMTPLAVVKRIEKYLGLHEMEVLKDLPVLMATETPALKRWRKRNDLLLTLGRREEVASMMGSLGYEMNSETWL